MTNGYLITGQNIIITYLGKTKLVSRASENASAVIEFLKVGDYESATREINIEQKITDFGQNRIKVVNGVVYLDDNMCNTRIAKQILFFISQKLDPQPLIKFLEKLLQNSSKTAVDELYDFIEHGKFTIADDGDILAYKKITTVNGKLVDIYTKKMDNGIGKTVIMPRNKVDDNRNRTCSTGLHFCSYEYLKNYGSYNQDDDVVVLVKINPMHVVSIPVDYNFSKGRASEYKIISIIDYKLDSGVVSTKTLKKETKMSKTLKRDSKGRFLSRAAILAMLPKRDSKGRFVSSKLPSRDSKGRFLPKR